MKQTSARKSFKKRFGQSNHYLITTLVGLDGISTNKIKTKPDSFSTSWNPRNASISADRSRNFVLNLFLISAVESIEFYFGILNKDPKPEFPSDLQKIFDSTGRKIYFRAIGMGKFLNVDETLIAFVDLLITWRNNITHAYAKNTLEDKNKNHLINEKDQIYSDYRGLDIVSCIEGAEEGKDVRFKEAASLINATHKFIENVDCEFIKIFAGDIQQIIFDLVKKELRNNISFRQRYFSKPEAERNNLVLNLVSNTVGACDYDWLEISVRIKKSELN